MSQDQVDSSVEVTTEPENISDVLPGEQLKTARLALGLSVSDVSNQLKLTAGKIESLERSEIAEIAAPVFVAGYLRAYARLLGLSENDVLADFEVLSAMQSSEGDAAPEEPALESGALTPDGVISTALPSQSSEIMFNQPKSVLVPVLMGLLVVGVVYFMLSENETRDEVPVVSALSEVPEEHQLSDQENLQHIPENISENIPQDAPENISANIPVNNGATTALSVSSVDEAGKAMEPADEKAQIEASAEVLPQSELEIVVTGDSWVEITDAKGERLVYRLAKAGLSHTVSGVAPFDVRLGYVPGVALFYNGAPYDLSRYAGRRSARFRIGKAGDHVTNE
jgi:cytoskeleton protein RodZ